MQALRPLAPDSSSLAAEHQHQQHQQQHQTEPAAVVAVVAVVEEQPEPAFEPALEPAAHPTPAAAAAAADGLSDVAGSSVFAQQQQQQQPVTVTEAVTEAVTANASADSLAADPVAVLTPTDEDGGASTIATATATEPVVPVVAVVAVVPVAAEAAVPVAGAGIPLSRFFSSHKRSSSQGDIAALDSSAAATTTSTNTAGVAASARSSSISSSSGAGSQVALLRRSALVQSSRSATQMAPLTALPALVPFGTLAMMPRASSPAALATGQQPGLASLSSSNAASELAPPPPPASGSASPSSSSAAAAAAAAAATASSISPSASSSSGSLASSIVSSKRSFRLKKKQGTSTPSSFSAATGRSALTKSESAHQLSALSAMDSASSPSTSMFSSTFQRSGVVPPHSPAATSSTSFFPIAARPFAATVPAQHEPAPLGTLLKVRLLSGDVSRVQVAPETTMYEVLSYICRKRFLDIGTHRLLQTDVQADNATVEIELDKRFADLKVKEVRCEPVSRKIIARRTENYRNDFEAVESIVINHQIHLNNLLKSAEGHYSPPESLDKEITHTRKLIDMMTAQKKRLVSLLMYSNMCSSPSIVRPARLLIFDQNEPSSMNTSTDSLPQLNSNGSEATSRTTSPQPGGAASPQLASSRHGSGSSSGTAPQTIPARKSSVFSLFTSSGGGGDRTSASSTPSGEFSLPHASGSAGSQYGASLRPSAATATDSDSNNSSMSNSTNQLNEIAASPPGSQGASFSPPSLSVSPSSSSLSSGASLNTAYKRSLRKRTPSGRPHLGVDAETLEQYEQHSLAAKRANLASGDSTSSLISLGGTELSVIVPPTPNRLGTPSQLSPSSAAAEAASSNLHHAMIRASLREPQYECGFCHLPIVAEREDDAVEAMNKVWHRGHFRCTLCDCSLDLATKFFEHNEQPYCERDFLASICARCVRCDLPIIGRMIIAAPDKFWHPEHFLCIVCNENMEHRDYVVRGADIYCQRDFERSGGQRCSGCKNFIHEAPILTLRGAWHKQCLSCAKCRADLSAGYWCDDLDDDLVDESQPDRPTVSESPKQVASAPSSVASDAAQLDANQVIDYPKLFERAKLVRQPSAVEYSTPPPPPRALASAPGSLVATNGADNTSSAPNGARLASTAENPEGERSGVPIYTFHGQPLCERDFFFLKHRICVHCQQPIRFKEPFVKLGDASHPYCWHKEHFVCMKCGILIQPGAELELDSGRVFCSIEHTLDSEPPAPSWLARRSWLSDRDSTV